MNATWNRGWRLGRLNLRVTLGTLAVVAMPVLAAGQAGPEGQVTFTKDIAPILQRSCQNCHRPGGIAPMSLLTYEEARPWARSIKLRVARSQSDPERMPPWFIEKNVGIQKFQDDPSLSDKEIGKVVRWVDSGAPRGNPADLPPPRKFADGTEWTIGTPDLIVSSAVWTVPAVAPDYQGEFEPITPVGLSEDRWVKAVEIREVRIQERAVDGSPAVTSRAALSYSVFHHAVIAARTELAPEDESGTVGRQGDNFHIAHEAGQNATIYPDELGVRLPAGSFLTWDLHTHSYGKEVQVRIDVAFKLHPMGYKPKYNLGPREGVNGFGSLTNHDLDIPAGESDVMFDAVRALTKPAKLWTFEPHMHASGKRMCLQATYPSGARQTLNCAGYNHNWVKVYNYAADAAPLLPTGTILQVIGWYDNSARNPRNAEPRNWKGFGNRSIEDMMFFFGKFVTLTDEQYKEEVAARQAKQRTNQ